MLSCVVCGMYSHMYNPRCGTTDYCCALKYFSLGEARVRRCQALQLVGPSFVVSCVIMPRRETAQKYRNMSHSQRGSSRACRREVLLRMMHKVLFASTSVSKLNMYSCSSMLQGHCCDVMGIEVEAVKDSKGCAFEKIEFNRCNEDEMVSRQG